MVCSVAAHAVAGTSRPAASAATLAAVSHTDGQACRACRALDAVLETFTLLMPTHWLGSVRTVLSLMQPLSPIRPAASHPPPTAVRCRVRAAWLAGAEGCPLRATRGVLGVVGIACTLLSDPRLAPRRIGSAACRGRPCVVRTGSWPGSWQSPLDSGQRAG